MNFSDAFKQVVTLGKQHDLFIGYGNPNAKILIIGKEIKDESNSNNAIDRIRFFNTIANNATQWENNIQSNIDKRDLPNCTSKFNTDAFNPLIPYKGMEEKQQHPSETWRKYQKLYEYIFGESLENYSFLDGCFITELNQIPSLKSNDQNPITRKESIKKRTQYLFNTDFFQEFPIIIMANGHYPKENDVDICELFQVEWDGKTIPVEGCKSPQWYNIHNNKKSEPKLLLHTRQLSSDVSNKLLESLANEIRKRL